MKDIEKCIKATKELDNVNIENEDELGEALDRALSDMDIDDDDLDDFLEGKISTFEI